MNIALFGYGKMGKKVKEFAESRGHTIIAIANSNNPTKSINLENVDVAIEFSTPTTAAENIIFALNNNIPIIIGTTGWLHNLSEVETVCKKKNGAILYSSNFSIGMNIFYEVNKQLAQLMKTKGYEINIHEIHHTQKLDTPSGTAKTLALQIEEITGTGIPITAERIGNTPGTHIVTHHSLIDDIEIKHTAHNRDGFAFGAILAAEWIIGKKGIFGMQDVLNFTKK